MTNVAAERDAFEAWYAKRHPKPTHENSTWAHCAKMDDWEVWQARAGAAPAAVARVATAGWRLVPAVPTRDWIAAVADGGYEDCDCASLIADILSRAPSAPALEAPAAPEPVRESDVRDMIGMVESGQAEEHHLLQFLQRLVPDRPVTLAAAPQAPAAPSPYSADLLAALGQWHQRCEVMGAHHTLTETQIAELVVAGLLRRAHGGQVITTAGRAALAAPAAPAVDAETVEDAERFRAMAKAVLGESGERGRYPELGEDATLQDVRATFDAAIAAQAAAKGASDD